MGNIEAKPIQLGLGEVVISRGFIRQAEQIVVPTRAGHCKAALEETIEAEDMHGLWNGHSAFKTTQSFKVGRTIRGKFCKWPIPQGSTIGAHSTQFKRQEKIVQDIPFL
jgi:hypothetical protein